MSQNLAHLCSLLIEDTYGPLYSHIFSVLMTHGSLSTNAITQKCHLPISQVRAGLAALVQHLLVFHHTASDGRTSYQANTRSAYKLIRVGSYTQSIRRKFGDDGVRILRYLHKFGHATISELQEVLEKENNKTVDESVSIFGGRLKSPLPRVLSQMVAEEYLIDLQAAHFQIWDDTKRDVETAVIASGNLSNAKGKKGRNELDGNVIDEIRKRFGGDRSGQTLIQHAKRAAEDILESQKAKRSRMTNGASSEANDGHPSLIYQSNVGTSGRIQSSSTNIHQTIATLRLNYNKVNKVLRHERLARQVTSRMGHRSGQVLASILNQYDSQPQNLVGLSQSKVDERAAEESIYDINIDQLLLGVNARDCRLDDEADTEWTRSTQPNSQDRNSMHTNGYANGDSISSDDVDEQMSTLAEASTGLIFQDHNTGIWKIDLAISSMHLLDEEIMRLVKRRFGSTALRIIRILIERGKVDEKSLQEIGLLNAKDLRRSLAQLSSHGYIDLQEVPREPQRQPTRTIYLWFYDSERVRQRVLEDFYKAMVRMLQRLKLERNRIHSTLEKVERSDVKGSEQKYLGHAEMELLKRWRRKEIWFTSGLDRLANSVAMLSAD